MNKTSAKEWLNKAWHHLSSAKLLYEAKHYTDIIGVELHYSIEITLKSFLAYENKQIKKTHELFEIYELVNDFITLDDIEIKLLVIAAKYHILEAYPTPHKTLPAKEEISEVLDFTEELFNKVCDILKIDKQEVMR